MSEGEEGSAVAELPRAQMHAHMPNSAGEQAVYVVIRRDLKMRRGKEIAQGVHAVAKLGYVEGAPLVVLQAPDFEAMCELSYEAEAANVPWATTRDAGRTEVEPGTVTALAIGPVAKGFLPNLSRAELY